MIVTLNEELLEVIGDDVTQEQVFAHAIEVLKSAVGGISALNRPVAATALRCSLVLLRVSARLTSGYARYCPAAPMIKGKPAKRLL